MAAVEDEFKIWVTNQPKGDGQMGMSGAVLKNEPHVCKTVTCADYGNTGTGVVKKRELRFRSAPRNSTGPGFDFDAAASWACENDEVSGF